MTNGKRFPKEKIKEECKEPCAVKWGCLGIDRLYIYNKQVENDNNSLKSYQNNKCKLIFKSKISISASFYLKFCNVIGLIAEDHRSAEFQ